MERNIYQRVNEVINELGTVAKNLNVAVSKTNSYKAVSEVDIINAVKPLEYKHGIMSYPCDSKVIDSGEVTQQTSYGDKTLQFVRIERTYRFVNVDKPEEYIEVKGYGDGIDSGDKATGKAITYADKYCLMKAYKISTGDDPDQNASEQVKRKIKASGTSDINYNERVSEYQIRELKLRYTEQELSTFTEKLNHKDLRDWYSHEAERAINAKPIKK